MKRNNLTTAVVAAIAGVAGFAGLANAVDLNPDGLGQVLIYPYYTVNKSQDTAFSVVNTTSIGKAIKVRFLEGYNSREVLDFNLFLSPNDVWTAHVSQTSATGGAAVFTTDHSCTFPPIPSGGQAFVASAYAGGSVFPPDNGPTSITRTREGYLELIEMGDIVPGSPLDGATTHVQNGQPNGGVPPCSSAIGANTAGGNLSAPTGGLFGSGFVVNVGSGIFFGYDADAIDGFSSNVLYSSSLLTTPSLQQANSANSSFVGGAVGYVFNNGKLLTLDYANGIDAVSAVFEAQTLYNEYLTAAGLGANTDWVVTFPTKRFYVDPFYTSCLGAIPPFPNEFIGSGGCGASGHGDASAPATIVTNVYDQEEGTVVAGGFSPPGVNPNALSWEVNVISFLNPTDPNAGVVSGVFGSALVANVAPYGGQGWLGLDLATGDGGHAMRIAANGDVLHGLPGTGFEAFDIINANAQPGLLANYGGLFRHRASRSCTFGAAACS